MAETNLSTTCTCRSRGCFLPHDECDCGCDKPQTWREKDETRYVIHKGDSYVRLAQINGRTLAAMVRDSREATHFDFMATAVYAALEANLGNTWAVEAVKSC